MRDRAHIEPIAARARERADSSAAAADRQRTHTHTTTAITVSFDAEWGLSQQTLQTGEVLSAVVLILTDDKARVLDAVVIEPASTSA